MCGRRGAAGAELAGVSAPLIDPGERRHHLARAARSLAKTLIQAAVLLGVYALIPVGTNLGTGAVVRGAIALAVFLVVVGWQLSRVTRAEHPRLRAAEALVVAFVLLVLGFAYIYLAVSRGDPASISEHLDRVGAVYFALTNITTVGFGDIVARSDAARIVVCAQLILDVILIFGVVRVYFSAAEIVRQRRDAPVKESDS